MSLGMVLKGVRDYLRTQHTWDYKQCGVHVDAKPPAVAGNFFVAIDDGGVETGPDDTHALTEVFNLEIGVWRRRSGHPDDRLKHMEFPDDIYLPGLLTLEDLERKVIVARNAAGTWSGGLHHNWGLTASINTLFSLPSETIGPEFTGQLVFKGFGRMETTPSLGTTEAAYFGRKLKFKGLRRVQIISGARTTAG